VRRAAEELGTLGGAHSFAADINARGQIVGWSQTPDGVYRAFIKNPGKPMRDVSSFVENLPSGTVLQMATAINDRGWIVGRTSNGHTFLLRPRD